MVYTIHTCSAAHKILYVAVKRVIFCPLALMPDIHVLGTPLCTLHQIAMRACEYASKSQGQYLVHILLLENTLIRGGSQ